MAERGFEPTVPSRVHLISSPTQGKQRQALQGEIPAKVPIRVPIALRRGNIKPC